jgi:hypothetical protein
MSSLPFRTIRVRTVEENWFHTISHSSRKGREPHQNGGELLLIGPKSRD